MRKRLLCLLFCFTMCLSVMTGCQKEKEQTPVDSSDETFATSSDEHEQSTDVLEDPTLPTVSEALKIPDFIVNVESGRDPIVLQLTDPQIIDAAQQRYSTRLNERHQQMWATDRVEQNCYRYIRDTIETTKPNLIIITGDLVYGEFDDSGVMLQNFIQFMDSFQIPWAPVFGNHEVESKKGVDWQCEQLENAQYCLFKQRTLTGNGNYSVGIVQDGSLKRVFYMLDSNGSGAASEESLANGHTVSTAGFGRDQIQWYTDQIQSIHAVSPNTKISFAYHIQQLVFQDAYAKYGFDNATTQSSPINIDCSAVKEDGDFGYLGRNLKYAWDRDYGVWNAMKGLGVDSIFVGHEHCNSASVVYEGVRFQFGQKSSTYDRSNYLTSGGTVLGSYFDDHTPMAGGTVIVLSKDDGIIKDAYIYMSGFENGEIDWKGFETLQDEEVSGLQKGLDLTVGAGVSITGISDGSQNAYEVVALTQGKLYINPSLLVNAKTFSFSVYVPKSTITLSGVGNGSFGISILPQKSEPIADGKIDGCVNYSISASSSETKLKFDVWQTFTLDISMIDSSCTEFAFIIPAGGTIYLRDITVKTYDGISTEDLPVVWL